MSLRGLTIEKAQELANKIQALQRLAAMVNRHEEGKSLEGYDY